MKPKQAPFFYRHKSPITGQVTFIARNRAARRIEWAIERRQRRRGIR